MTKVRQPFPRGHSQYALVICRVFTHFVTTPSRCVTPPRSRGHPGGPAATRRRSSALPAASGDRLHQLSTHQVAPASAHAVGSAGSSVTNSPVLSASTTTSYPVQGSPASARIRRTTDTTSARLSRSFGLLRPSGATIWPATGRPTAQPAPGSAAARARACGLRRPRPVDAAAGPAGRAGRSASAGRSSAYRRTRTADPPSARHRSPVPRRASPPGSCVLRRPRTPASRRAARRARAHDRCGRCSAGRPCPRAMARSQGLIRGTGVSSVPSRIRFVVIAAAASATHASTPQIASPGEARRPSRAAPRAAPTRRTHARRRTAPRTRTSCIRHVGNVCRCADIRARLSAGRTVEPDDAGGSQPRSCNSVLQSVAGAQRARRRGHRQRLRRHRDGDQAQAGRPRRLRHPREGQRPRRHLARQHLPGLRVRRPVPPVLVLVRAEPAAGPGCSPRRRRSGTTCATVVDKYDLAPHIRYGAEVTGATSTTTPAPGTWWSTAARLLDARVLVSGVGALHMPSLPDIPGLETFEGETFHSAQWRHDHDLTGRNGRRHRHRRERDPVRPADRARGRAPRPLPAHAAWVTPKPDPRISAKQQAVYARHPLAAASHAQPPSTGRSRSRGTGFALTPKAMKLLEKQRPPPSRTSRSPIPSCAPS